ncbi:MAG TPA: PAN domain-containing protein [Caulobacterales bacterium]|nr:PAN domain-containing protein [Caulobacterales bacterium]
MRAIRTSALTLCLFAAGFGASAQTPPVGQVDVAFQGGGYASLHGESAAACAQLCAQDNICMAWTFRAAQQGACELKAVIPHATPETGAVSGLSSRAPDFARQLAEAAPAKAPVAAVTRGAADVVAANASDPAAGAGPQELLGGPPDDELRSQFEEQTARR